MATTLSKKKTETENVDAPVERSLADIQRELKELQIDFDPLAEKKRREEALLLEARRAKENEELAKRKVVADAVQKWLPARQAEIEKFAGGIKAAQEALAGLDSLVQRCCQAEKITEFYPDMLPRVQFGRSFDSQKFISQLKAFDLRVFNAENGLGGTLPPNPFCKAQPELLPIPKGRQPIRHTSGDNNESGGSVVHRVLNFVLGNS